MKEWSKLVTMFREKPLIHKVVIVNSLLSIVFIFVAMFITSKVLFNVLLVVIASVVIVNIVILLIKIRANNKN